MPTLDYGKAVAAGYSDSEILAHVRKRPGLRLVNAPQTGMGGDQEFRAQLETMPPEQRMAFLQSPEARRMLTPPPSDLEAQTARAYTGFIPAATAILGGTAGLATAGPLGLAAGSGLGAAGGHRLQQAILEGMGVEAGPGLIRSFVFDPGGEVGRAIDITEAGLEGMVGAPSIRAALRGVATGARAMRTPGGRVALANLIPGSPGTKAAKVAEEAAATRGPRPVPGLMSAGEDIRHLPVEEPAEALARLRQEAAELGPRFSRRVDEAIEEYAQRVERAPITRRTVIESDEPVRTATQSAKPATPQPAAKPKPKAESEARPPERTAKPAKITKVTPKASRYDVQIWNEGKGAYSNVDALSKERLESFVAETNRKAAKRKLTKLQSKQLAAAKKELGLRARGKVPEPKKEAAAERRGAARESAPRHKVQYESSTKGKVRIEDMNAAHIENAINKFQRIAKTRKLTQSEADQLDALMKERIYQAETTGAHLGLRGTE